MDEISYRVVEQFPEPAYAELVAEAFADYEASAPLAFVLADEAAARSGLAEPSTAALRIGAFRGDVLMGWTYARTEADGRLHMINSGVAAAVRRQGIYSELVRRVVEHARSHGYVAVVSRHAADNNAVIIAKLKQGFVVSGFEYSEVYGPLVRLTCLMGERRRNLYRERTRPLRRADVQ